MSDLTKLIDRWNNREKFFEAMFKKLCEQMTKELRDHTPGKTLPLEWNYDVIRSGNTVEARIWNQRVEDDPDFVRILMYLDLGTYDHWIFPVRAWALHWIDELTGEHRFSKGHKVSGIKASDFSARAEIVLLEYKAKVPAMWGRYMNSGRMP
jgi:hypothetical protein